MKNASKHADELKSLLKKLVKDRPERPTMDPLVAVVRGTLAQDATDEQVDDAMRRIDAEFVDLNELRVATELEVAALVGDEHPRIDEKTTELRAVLHDIFENEQVLKLDRVKELKKAEIRSFLKELELITPFAEAYAALHAFDVPAFPIDGSTLDYLTDEGILEPDTSLEDAQAFLENTIKADDLYGAYLAIRERALAHEKKKPAKPAAAAVAAAAPAKKK
jgi:endonuclease III